MPTRRRSPQRGTRREGFANQKLIVLPETIVRNGMGTPLLGGFIVVAAGFFPVAERHLVERVRPLADAIVILCVSGQGWVQVGHEKRVPVGADALVLLGPGEVHAYGADDLDPWSIYWAHFRGGESAEFFHLFGISNENPVIRLPRGVAGQVGFNGVYDRLEEDYTVPNLLSAAARLRMIFIELHRFRAGYGNQAKPDPIERTIKWMREHLREPANLSQLARHAALSVSRFSAVFRRRTGYSPVDYFLRMKMQRACQLLDTTPLLVDEIAAIIGYEDSFYFSRLFRRVMAKSPRAYRAAVKG